MDKVSLNQPESESRQKYNPTRVEKEFISAFENLRSSVLEQLIENRERDVGAWKPFWEIQSLLHRLYNGEEEIVGIPKKEPAS